MKEKYIKYLGKAVRLRDVFNVEGLSDEELLQGVVKFYERSSRQIARERTGLYQEKLKVSPRSVTIDKISSRWGSCNFKKEITYNYLICTLPIELIDYIVVHELSHIHHMNHDRSFWRKVGSIVPDYKKKTAMLKSIGAGDTGTE